MGFIRGWLYCFLWYTSILAGYCGLFCPLLPILFVSNRWYRYCTDVLFTFWQYYPTVLLETLCNCHVQVTGDTICTSEAALLVMNHRTRTDWNFLWPTMYHCISGKRKFCYPTKFVLKDIIRHIPGPGWVMQLSCFLYLRRSWHLDQHTLQRALSYFSSLPHKPCLLLFPEGTDLTPSTKHRSDRYALTHHLPPYEHVLHPRTTGFAFLAHHLLRQHNLDAVYDLTLAYPDTVPQDERALLAGRFPQVVRVHLVRYPAAQLPRSEAALKEFLEGRWRDKERALKEFYSSGTFLHGPTRCNKERMPLRVALVFWTVLPWVVGGLLVMVPWFRLLVVLHTVFLLVVNMVASSGFQSFEIGMYQWRLGKDLINL